MTIGEGLRLFVQGGCVGMALVLLAAYKGTKHDPIVLLAPIAFALIAIAVKP